MDTPNESETALLVPIPGITSAVRDTRSPFQKKLAIYLILGSTLFERIAFYSLAGNFAPSIRLADDKPCSNNIIGTFIFSGK